MNKKDFIKVILDNDFEKFSYIIDRFNCKRFLDIKELHVISAVKDLRILEYVFTKNLLTETQISLVVEFAIYNNNIKAVDYLLSRLITEPYFFYDLDTILRKGINDNNFECVKFVLEKTNFQDFDSLLIPAARKNNTELVKYIIEKDVDTRFNYDDVLNYAVYNGNFELVEYLIQKGANVNIEFCANYYMNEKIETYYDMLQFLVEHGFNIKENGSSLLYNLVLKNDYKAIKFLIENGAKIPESELVESSYHDYLRTKNEECFEIAKYLLKKGAYIYNPTNMRLKDIKDYIIPNHTFLNIKEYYFKEMIKNNKTIFIKFILSTTPKLLQRENILKLLLEYNKTNLIFDNTSKKYDNKLKEKDSEYELL